VRRYPVLPPMMPLGPRRASSEVHADENEMFVDAVRSLHYLAAVFEFDGDTGYFYLFDPRAPAGTGIMTPYHGPCGPRRPAITLCAM
jgi:hypothetical protein